MKPRHTIDPTPMPSGADCAVPCPVEATIGVIGGKWKATILYNLRSGPVRFNGLRRLIPEATQRMMTLHLRELERDGVVRREIRAVVPPHVEYSLTPRGHSLTPILAAMAEWGRRFRDEAGEEIREIRGGEAVEEMDAGTNTR